MIAGFEKAIGGVDETLLVEYARNEIRIARLTAELHRSPLHQLLTQAGRVQEEMRRRIDVAVAANMETRSSEPEAT